MRLTVIPNDRFMSKNGIGLIFEFSAPGIHAIQWDTDHGHIERKGQPNEKILDSSIIAPYVVAYDTEVARLEAVYNSPAKVAERAEQAEQAAIDMLVNQKIKDIAIAELKKEGKLTADGKRPK